MLKTQSESDVARKYFSNLVNDSGRLKQQVEEIDLEGPAPGIAGGYNF